MRRKGFVFLLVALCCGSCARLPLKDPCLDSAYMALRFHVPDSLIGAQRAYLHVKDSECQVYQEKRDRGYIPNDATEGTGGGGVSIGVIALFVMILAAVAVIEAFKFLGGSR